MPKTIDHGGAPSLIVDPLNSGEEEKESNEKGSAREREREDRSDDKSSSADIILFIVNIFENAYERFRSR